MHLVVFDNKTRKLGKRNFHTSAEYCHLNFESSHLFLKNFISTINKVETRATQEANYKRLPISVIPKNAKRLTHKL